MELTEESKKSLLNILKECYDYDFSGYSEASLNRRIKRYADQNHFNTFFDLKHELINNRGAFENFVIEVTVNVTEMFRDPDFFRAMINEVFPLLATYPFNRIWHAGCSTGEEVYSMAILLKEQKLYEQSRLYGTDINPQVLRLAAEGCYNPSLFSEYQKQYALSGGMNKLDAYYTLTDNGKFKMTDDLKKNLLFSSHNLVSDGSINEFNMIICRNVLIYFNSDLQESVFELFYNSLCIFGFLALGSKETLQFSKWNDKFEIVNKKEKIYRKIA